MNPLAILAFVKDHWKLVAGGAGGLALLLAGGAAGFRLHAILNPCQVCAPAVTSTVTAKKVESLDQVKSAKVEKGPRRKVTFDFAKDTAQRGTPPDLCRPIVVPGLGTDPVTYPPMPGELVRMTIEDDGPSTSSSSSETKKDTAEQKSAAVAITPAVVVRLPRLELQGGLEDLLHPKLDGLRLAGRVRVDDRVWLELSGKPFEKTVGAGVAFSF